MINWLKRVWAWMSMAGVPTVSVSQEVYDKLVCRLGREDLVGSNAVLNTTDIMSELLTRIEKLEDDMRILRCCYYENGNSERG